jgi:hypothetical protein
MLTVVRTHAFRSFQRAIGRSTFYINTAYIGLELVARGGTKPDDLRIKWTQPRQPREEIAQVRQFLHSAMLGYCFGALDNYLRELADDLWLPLSRDTRAIIRKSVTKPKGVAYSIPERFSQLETERSQKVAEDALLVAVLTAWRNQSVHEEQPKASFKARLEAELSEELRTHSASLATRYGDLQVGKLLEHVESNRPPSRKDIIALASAAQNYVRAIDEGLLIRHLNSQEAIERVALAEIRRALLEPPGKLIQIVWGKDPTTRARRLTAILEEAGFAKSGELLPSLSDCFLDDFARRSLLDAIRQLGGEPIRVFRP